LTRQSVDTIMAAAFRRAEWRMPSPMFKGG
jgi:hypothetical protein